MHAKRTVGDWIVEAIALACLVQIVGFLFLKWPELPAQVPTHFGASGLPDHWGNKGKLWVLPMTSVFLYISLTAASRYQKLLNIPFTIDRDAPEVQQILLSLSITLKVVTILPFAYISWTGINTALGRASGLGPLFLPAFLTLTFAPLIFYFLKLRPYQKP